MGSARGMPKKRRVGYLGVAGFALAGLWMGCGGADEAPAGAVERRDGVAIVRIDSDDRMHYSLESFDVRSGERVRLVLAHTGRRPAASMGHNVVILRAGEQVGEFARAALSRGGDETNGYLPDVLQPRVLAHTAMIGGGERDSVEFVAPAPGTHGFLCTFPGHVGTMKGTMRVLAR